MRLETSVFVFFFFGFLVSRYYFMMGMAAYKNGERANKPEFARLLSHLFGVPVLVVLMLLIGLSTGLVGM